LQDSMIIMTAATVLAAARFIRQSFAYWLPTALQFTMSKGVVVVGGFGFIGQTLVKQLLEAQFKVLVIDDLSVPVGTALGRFRNVDFVQTDVVNLTSEHVSGFENACWIHLAAAAFIPETFLFPWKTVQTNILGTLRACRIAVRSKASRFVLISSSEVYGSTAAGKHLHEASPTRPQSLYAISKLMGERVVREFALSELPWVIVRLFNAYGENATHPYFVPETIRQCLKTEKITIGNLDSRRDFTLVGDSAEAIVRATSATEIEGETINICSGRAERMRDLLRKIQELTKATSKRVIVDPSRLRPTGTDPELLIGDANKALRLLGWHSKVQLEQGLKQTIEAYVTSGNWPYEEAVFQSRCSSGVSPLK
jgi:nucleoside-diphosphate-sugar epimerase